MLWDEPHVGVNKGKEALVLILLSCATKGKGGHSQIQKKTGNKRFLDWRKGDRTDHAFIIGHVDFKMSVVV